MGTSLHATGLLVMKTLSTSALQVILKINWCKLKHKEIFYNGFGDCAIVPVTFCWGRHARPQGVLAEIPILKKNENQNI